MFISFTCLIIKLILILNKSGLSHQNTSCARWSWDPDDVGPDGLPCGRPLILGHRGSSGMYPEHTVISYIEGAKQGADIIECDMVLTKVNFLHWTRPLIGPVIFCFSLDTFFSFWPYFCPLWEGPFSSFLGPEPIVIAKLKKKLYSKMLFYKLSIKPNCL